MEQLIRECAQRIVAVLADSDGVNILRLSERLTERSVVVYQAVGWLAREGRLVYEQREKQVFVRLRDDPGDGGTSMRPR